MNKNALSFQKWRVDLLEIVLLQKCAGIRQAFNSYIVVKSKIARKQFSKSKFIQNKDIDYYGFLLTSTGCFSGSFYR